MHTLSRFPASFSSSLLYLSGVVVPSSPAFIGLISSSISLYMYSKAVSFVQSDICQRLHPGTSRVGVIRTFHPCSHQVLAFAVSSYTDSSDKSASVQGCQHYGFFRKSR